MKYLPFFYLLFLIGCTPSEKKLTAQRVIGKTMLFSGADKVYASEISFKFRDKVYSATRSNGSFKLFRSFTKDSIVIVDVLRDDGYERSINAQVVQVADSMVLRNTNSINFVHYFSVLLMA